MEPMNLGTPSNSGPSSPTTPSGSPYLPSFLLGEPTTPLPGSTSPKMKRGSLNDSQHYMSPRYFTAQSPTPQAPESQFGSEKVSGPPIRGLFDTVTSPGPNRETKKTTSEVNAYVASVSRQFVEGRMPTTPMEAADSTWVTVFGYPPAAASFILSHIASCGQIVSRQVPASGNWMHIQFSSRLEARRALASNGKIFAGSVMVGVQPCRDQNVMGQKDKTMDLPPADTSSISTIASPQRSFMQNDMHRSVDASVYESPYGSPRIPQARALITRHDTEVYGSGTPPHKNTGIVSKAMEYILGW